MQKAKTEGDKNYLTRKCEQLDKEINQLACLAVRQVYQFTRRNQFNKGGLYGLTKEETCLAVGK